MAVVAQDVTGPGAHRQRSGISIIETTIALAILAVGLLAMLAVQVSALQQGSWGRHTSEASQIARDQMELIRRLPWADPVAQPTAWTAPIAVSRAVQSPGGAGVAQQQFNLQWRITTAGFDPNLRLVDVRVQWVENDNNPAGNQRRYAMSSTKYNE